MSADWAHRSGGLQRQSPAASADAADGLRREAEYCRSASITLRSREPTSRSVRVFLSSCFRDMRGERDALMQLAFPKIRTACAKMGLHFNEVDLRWGLPDEMRETSVIATCLHEALQCRPYTIALLGERYGWTPSAPALQAAAALLEQSDPDEDWSWLCDAGCEGKSITELEMICGIFLAGADDRRCLAYLRDKQYIDSVPATEHSDYVNDSSDADRRQLELKARLQRELGDACHAYTSPADLANMIVGHVMELIRKDYGELGVFSDPLQQERFSHLVFAESRERTYIKFPMHERVIAELCEASSTDNHELANVPVLLFGEVGSGKSSLLAHLVHRVQQRNSTGTGTEHIVFHAIGQSSHSANYVTILRRIFCELSSAAKLTAPVPDEAGALINSLPLCLLNCSSAMPDHQFYVVIDALNQLQDTDKAHELRWLPNRLPANIHLIASTASVEHATKLSDRGWRTVQMPSFSMKERHELMEKIAVKYLRQFGKDMEVGGRLRRIVEADQSRSPLFLKIALDELRIVGVHESLGQQIDDLLRCRDVVELYDLVLRRLETTYDRKLVETLMSFVYCARHGLSETELLGAMRVPRVKLTPILDAVQESFVGQSGLFLFYHDSLAHAVQRRYLSSKKTLRHVHRLLAEYFMSVDRENPRRVAELPWHLRQSEDIAGLVHFLSDVPSFIYMMDSPTMRMEMAAHWRECGLDGKSGTVNVNGERQSIGSIFHHSLNNYFNSIPALSALDHARIICNVGVALEEWACYRVAKEMFHWAVAETLRRPLVQMPSAELSISSTDSDADSSDSRDSRESGHAAGSAGEDANGRVLAASEPLPAAAAAPPSSDAPGPVPATPTTPKREAQAEGAGRAASDETVSPLRQSSWGSMGSVPPSPLSQGSSPVRSSSGGGETPGGSRRPAPSDPKQLLERQLSRREQEIRYFTQREEDDFLAFVANNANRDPEESKLLVEVFVSLQRLYTHIGERRKALMRLEQAQLIQERLFGPKSIEVCGILDELGWLLIEHKRYQTKSGEPGAVDVLKRSLYIRMQAIFQAAGIKESEVCDNRVDLSDPRWQLALQGAFDSGLDNIDTALNRLAVAYKGVGERGRLGMLDLAEEMHEWALRIREKLYGQYHPDVGTCCCDIGSLLHSKYRVALGLSPHLPINRAQWSGKAAAPASSASDKSFGEHSSNTSSMQVSPQVSRESAVSFKAHDAWSSAIRKVKTTTSFAAAAAGRTQPAASAGPSSEGGPVATAGAAGTAASAAAAATAAATAGSQTQAAAADVNPDEIFVKAASYLQRAVQIREAVYGDRHPFFASALMSLAALYMETREWDKAEKEMTRAHQIRVDAFGKRSRKAGVTGRQLKYIQDQRRAEKELLEQGTAAVEQALERGFGTTQPPPEAPTAFSRRESSGGASAASPGPATGATLSPNAARRGRGSPRHQDWRSPRSNGRQDSSSSAGSSASSAARGWGGPRSGSAAGGGPASSGGGARSANRRGGYGSDGRGGGDRRRGGRSANQSSPAASASGGAAAAAAGASPSRDKRPAAASAAKPKDKDKSKDKAKDKAKDKESKTAVSKNMFALLDME